MSEERQKFVVSWLKETLDTNKLPYFEFNDETTDVLYELAKKNIRRNADTQIIIEDLKMKTKEYHGEAQRLEEVLERINFTPKDLEDALPSINALSSLAVTLELKDVNTTR